jgi:hypothetical protein
MTKEQWLLYLYSIYPTSGGIFLFFMLIGSALTIAWIPVDVEYQEYMPTLKKWTKIYMISVLITFIFFSLIPSKKMALAIYATPNVMEYIDDNKSKLMKIDELLDLSLDKAIKELKEN